jgi:hypothetical protein
MFPPPQTIGYSLLVRVQIEVCKKKRYVSPGQNVSTGGYPFNLGQKMFPSRTVGKIM